MPHVSKNFILKCCEVAKDSYLPLDNALSKGQTDILHILDDPHGNPLRSIVKFETKIPEKRLFVGVRGTKGADVKAFFDAFFSSSSDSIHHTDGINNWVSNLSTAIVPLIPLFGGDTSPTAVSPYVHLGFQRCAEKCWPLIKNCLTNLFDNNEQKIKEVFLVGHSLGGAIATLIALPLQRLISTFDPNLKVFLVTFGSPRVGNNAFKALVNSAIDERITRVVNDFDPVTYAPFSVPGLVEYVHISDACNIQPAFSRHIGAARYFVHAFVQFAEGKGGVLARELIDEALNHHDLKLYTSFLTMGLAGVIAYNGTHVMKIVKYFIPESPADALANIPNLPIRHALTSKTAFSSGMLMMTSMTPAGALIVGLQVANLGVSIYNTIQLQKLSSKVDKLSDQVAGVSQQLNELSAKMDTLIAAHKQTQRNLKFMSDELAKATVSALFHDLSDVSGWQKDLFDHIIARNFAAIPAWHTSKSSDMHKTMERLLLWAQRDLLEDNPKLDIASHRILLACRLVEVRKYCMIINIQAQEQANVVDFNHKGVFILNMDEWYSHIGKNLGKLVSLSRHGALPRSAVIRLCQTFTELFGISSPLQLDASIENTDMAVKVSMTAEDVSSMELVRAMSHIFDGGELKQTRNAVYRALAVYPEDSAHTKFLLDVVLVKDKQNPHCYVVCDTLLHEASQNMTSSDMCKTRLEYYIFSVMPSIAFPVDPSQVTHLIRIVDIIQCLNIKGFFQVMKQLLGGLSVDQAVIGSIFDPNVVDYLSTALNICSIRMKEGEFKQKFISFLFELSGRFSICQPDDQFKGTILAMHKFLPAFQLSDGFSNEILSAQWKFVNKVTVPALFIVSHMVTSATVIRFWRLSCAAILAMHEACIKVIDEAVLDLISQIFDSFDTFMVSKEQTVNEVLLYEGVSMLTAISSLFKVDISAIELDLFLKAILKTVSLVNLMPTEIAREQFRVFAATVMFSGLLTDNVFVSLVMSNAEQVNVWEDCKIKMKL